MPPGSLLLIHLICRGSEEAFVAYTLLLQQTPAGRVDNWRRSSVRDRGGDDEGGLKRMMILVNKILPCLPVFSFKAVCIKRMLSILNMR